MRSRITESGSTALAVALLLLATCARAEPIDGYEGIAPLFADDSVLEVTIEAPLTTLMKERPDEDYLNGLFHFEQGDGTTKTLSLKLRTRGNYRRDPEHCVFAPIRLNFKKSELTGSLFDGQDKLKLVTHCQHNASTAEQMVAREYIAYRLLHELTSISYDVRMFRITYVDLDTGKKMRRLGFVIEDDEAVAARNGLQLVRNGSVSPADLDRQHQNLAHVFEYMIGNTEYSLVNREPGKDCCHNMDMLSLEGDPPYLPLPFDFDFAGLVNASYAQPNPRYPVPSVRTRFYKGVCTNNDLLPETLQLFLEHRDAVDRIIDDAPFLSRKSSRWIRQYLGSFYKTISDPEKVQVLLMEKCHPAEDRYDS